MTVYSNIAYQRIQGSNFLKHELEGSSLTLRLSYQHHQEAKHGSYRTGPTRSASEPTLHGLLSISQFGRLWATSGNLLGDEHTATKTPVRRKVEFQPLVRVVLIPSRTEYSSAGLLSILWWEDSDYSSFKSTAVRELKALMISRGIYSSRDAIKILYQPGSDDIDMALDVAQRPCDVEPSPDSPVLIDDYMNNDSIETYGQKGMKDSMGTTGALIDARTDVDLTELKRHLSV